MNDKKKLLNDQLLKSINEENPDTDNYLVPDEISKKARSLMSIKSDLGDAHAALTELSLMHLMPGGIETIMTALWKSGIVTYGKCFTNSNDGQSKLEIKDCFIDHEYFIGIHNSLINIRNGFIAHRGDNEFEDTVMIMKVDPKNPNETTYDMKSFRAGTSNFHNLVDYLNVIEHLQQYVELGIQKQIQKIHDRIYSDGNSKSD